MRVYKVLVFSLSFLAISNNVYAEEVQPEQEAGYDVEMNGKIGEWDPTKEGIFDNWGGEIEGEFPVADEYYTISVTVPLSMEFYVIQSHNIHGQFYSPEYAVKNNGSKNLKVSVAPLVSGAVEEGILPLYVEPIVPNDDRVQIELQVKELTKTDDSNVPENEKDFIFNQSGEVVSSEESVFEGEDSTTYIQNNKMNVRTDGNIINLFEVNESTPDEEMVLFDSISAEEKKIFTFDAINWELPKQEQDEDGNIIHTEARSTFMTSLLFEVISNE